MCSVVSRKDGVARLSTDDYYLDAVALNLHGFYGGLERIFERIAAVVDGARPSGEHWHRTLLRQMAEELPGVRPAVISEATHELLDPYRGFRHVARNVYTFLLDPNRLERLVAGAVRFLTVRDRNCWPSPTSSNGKGLDRSRTNQQRRADSRPTAQRFSTSLILSAN